MEHTNIFDEFGFELTLEEIAVNAYTEWAISSECPSIEEVCEKYFNPGTSHYEKLVELVTEKMDKEIRRRRSITRK